MKKNFTLQTRINQNCRKMAKNRSKILEGENGFRPKTDFFDPLKVLMRVSQGFCSKPDILLKKPKKKCEKSSIFGTFFLIILIVGRFFDIFSGVICGFIEGHFLSKAFQKWTLKSTLPKMMILRESGPKSQKKVIFDIFQGPKK